MIDLAPLRRFNQRIEKYASQTDYICAMIITVVRRTLEQYIQQTKGYSTTTVSLIPVSNTSNSVTAILDIHDEGLWFKEFGTGFVGEMSMAMQDYFPSDIQLTFFSRGELQHTQGWEYAYHPQTKKDGYWTYMGVKYEGQPAQNGVTLAIVRIKYSGIPRLAEWLRQELK